MKDLWKVRRNTLLMIAGFVWGVAGFNILRIGVEAYHGYFIWWGILISLAVYAAFQKFVFSRMVGKHTRRILQYKAERQYFFKFFDVQGFCIMAFMMALGIGLRNADIVPETYIAIFYTGLGASLLTAGVMFIANYLRVCGKKGQSNPVGLVN